MQKKHIAIDQSEEDALKEKFGEEWVKKVKEAAHANKPTSTYAASNASSRQEDQNMTSSRTNLQPPPGYHHTTWIATTYNQGQGAQQYRRPQYSAGPITQEIVDERYEDSAQWMERILNMNRDEKRFFGFLDHALKRVWNSFKDAQRSRFENR